MTEWVDIGALEDIPLRGARKLKTPIGCVGVFRTAANEVFALVREALNEKERELLSFTADVVKQRADSVDVEAAALKQRKHQLRTNAEHIAQHMKLDDPVGTLLWYSESKALLTQLGPGIGRTTPVRAWQSRSTLARLRNLFSRTRRLIDLA